MRQVATDVYQELGTRFGVNQTPTHVHNNIDAPLLPPTSITTAVTLSAQPGGVLYNNPCKNMQSPIVVFPVPVLTSAPSGTAPNGTLVLAPLGLYARQNNAWVFIGNP
jgi:hypothetical protein